MIQRAPRKTTFLSLTAVVAAGCIGGERNLGGRAHRSEALSPGSFAPGAYLDPASIMGARDCLDQESPKPGSASGGMKVQKPRVARIPLIERTGIRLESHAPNMLPGSEPRATAAVMSGSISPRLR